jgi:biopolymer transport protein ExbD
MRRVPPYRRARGEPAIALINIVFLLLVFFLVAGSLAAPLDRELSLVRTESLDGRALPDALIVRPDGATLHRGEATTPQAYLEALAGRDGAPRVARIVPDRELPAERLIEVARALQAAGAAEVHLVTERVPR